ncbi:MAG: recombinase family protein [Myxococcota bacterium]
MIASKVRSTHLSRRAIVYLRQSTLRQVHEHTESTTRQYALAERALSLGWTRDQIEVVDEDLGQSGTGTESRPGFRRLAEEVGRGQVGALLALEVSRFARSSADWHHLLDLCGVADVLIIDDQGVHDPQDPNDRLLLGLKGQMSEAEKYWMKLRMHGAKLSRARRGELRLVPPTGYVWDEAARRLAFDPDERVQRAVRLIFERFRIGGSAHGVQTWFIRQGLKVPARHLGDSEAAWVNPRPRSIIDMLKNPIYTGAYVYGRRETRRSLINGQFRTRVIPLPQDQWRVFLAGHHAAYITWEEYLANQEKMRANRATRKTPGEHRAALDGCALLQGIVICGKCGGRMQTTYVRSGARYLCKNPLLHGLDTSLCWSLSATLVDAEVERQFLATAQPEELDLCLAVSAEVSRQSEEVERQWALRLERAQYDARLAERRYKAVDPDNRVVARTLESDWEVRLRELAEVEQQRDNALQRQKLVLDDADRRRILELARDLPRVWRAPSTTWQQRKNLLRILVREVVLTPVDVPSRQTRIQILWEGGATTELLVDRPRWHSATRTEAEETIRTLVEQGEYDDQIAVALNGVGLTTAHGRPWDRASVRRVRGRLGIRRPMATPPGEKLPDRRADGLYSTRGVANRFAVSTPTVRKWVKLGILSPAEGGGRGCAAWFELDSDAVARIQAQLDEQTASVGEAS